MCAAEAPESEAIAMVAPTRTQPMDLGGRPSRVLLPAVPPTPSRTPPVWIPGVGPGVEALAVATPCSSIPAHSAAPVALLQLPPSVLLDVIQLTHPSSAAVPTKTTLVEVDGVPSRRARRTTCHPVPTAHDRVRRMTAATLETATLGTPAELRAGGSNGPHGWAPSLRGDPPHHGRQLLKLLLHRASRRKPHVPKLGLL